MKQINIRRVITKYKNQCPVCKKHYFSKSNSYEICPVCGWEDDELQRKDIDFEGGANSLSLRQYREKYYEKEN